MGKLSRKDVRWDQRLRRQVRAFRAPTMFLVVGILLVTEKGGAQEERENIRLLNQRHDRNGVTGNGKMESAGSNLQEWISRGFYTLMEGGVYEDWIARYNGSANGSDAATDLVVDGTGNVYVTGYSTGSGTSFDILTIKYDGYGHQLWTATYNGPQNRADYGGRISLDGSGNIYVIGTSGGAGLTNFDWVTIKYDASGNQQWSVRYWGPADEEDVPSDLVVDSLGNAYVAGHSTGWGTYWDFTTIKYNPSGGAEWVARYNGSGGSSDRATALAVDSWGGVCVTGSSSNDFLTIKYDPDGNQLWLARYNGPGDSGDGATDIDLDESGNVYVTGNSIGSGSQGDYTTIKYDSSGSTEWIARYNGPGNSYDIPTALAVDRWGSVYVTGWSTGGSYDCATVKYNASGVQQWVAAYTGPATDERLSDLALDRTGNVYVAGKLTPGGGIDDYDCATLKYTPSGDLEWLARYNGSDGASDGAAAIVLDNSGNVYVAGASTLLGSSSDYVTIKYRQGVSLLLPENMAIVYSEDVMFLWHRTSLGTEDRFWFEYSTDSLFLDSIIDSTLTDTTSAVFGLQHNQSYWWRVRAHSLEGWGSFSPVRRFLVFLDVPAPPVLVSPENGTTGVSLSPTVAWNEAAGAESYGLELSDTVDFSRLTFTQEDITGMEIGLSGLSGSTTYYWRVKSTNALGTSGWSEVWHFMTITTPAPPRLLSPENGATGVSTSPTVSWEEVVSAESYNLQLSDIEDFSRLIVDLRNIAVSEVSLNGLAGNTLYYWRANAVNGAGTGDWSVVWRFTTLVTSVEAPLGIPAEFSLSQNYPNPFNASTVIRYGLPHRSHVKLEIFDHIGQRIAILRDIDQEAGYHSVSFEDRGLASGVYLCRLRAGEFVQTRKMVLMR